MKKRYIENGWKLYGDKLASPVPARVPGCVHTDLYRAGIIPAPCYRDNNLELLWIEGEDWVFECELDAVHDEGARLVFEGLDTYAEVYLNGILLGETHNMFISHAFDVGDTLRDGKNILRVKFRSAVKEVEGCPPRVGAFTTERMNTRRVQCTYSWDWVDRFVTAGIFRPVYIAYPTGVEVDSAYVYTEHIDSFGAAMHLELDFTGYEKGGRTALVEILSPTGERVAKTEFYVDRKHYVRRLNVENPELWYPSGYGEQPLYTLRVTVDGNVFTEHFGIRTLRIVERADKEGEEYWLRAVKEQKNRHGLLYDRNTEFSGFLVVVNGVPVFCMGGNWVPCEPFVSEESDEKITKLVKMAREMGANFLRVWGGGLFERRAFYDACDREGILVAQDFLMACGTYPEKESWFIDELRLEAEFAAKYLRNHPSLAWWHGDNENAVEGSDTDVDYTGRESALSGLADIVCSLDPSRAFLSSSPYGGHSYGSVTSGTTHTTNFLGQIFEYFDTSDMTDYKEFLGGFAARFISEEGTFGAISTPSLRRFMTEEDLFDPEERMLCYHTKGNPSASKEIFEYVTTFAKRTFGEIRSTEERLFKYRFMQHEWVRLAMEAARRNIGYCNGMVFWMFNDCWPAALGWAMVDYYLMPKASYYSFRRLSAPAVVSVAEGNGGYLAHVSTLRGSVGEVKLTARLYNLNNMTDPVSTYESAVTSVERGDLIVSLPWTANSESFVAVEIEYKGGLDRSSYKRGLLPLSPTNALKYERQGNELTITALGYIHTVELEGEYIFSDNYFSMYNGEQRTVTLGEYAERANFTDEISISAYTVG